MSGLSRHTHLERFGLRVRLYYLDKGATSKSTLKWSFIDITQHCKDLTWSESIEPPYGRINVSIRQDITRASIVMGRLWPGWLSVQARVKNDQGELTDDWVTLQAGYITDFEETETNPDSGSRELRASIRAVSYFDFCRLFSLQICTVEGLGSLKSARDRKLLDGAMFTIDRWTEIAMDILGDVTDGDVGNAVATAFKSLARVQVPLGAFNASDRTESIYLSDLVEVSHDGKLESNNVVAGQINYRIEGWWELPKVPGMSIRAMQNSMSFGGSFGSFMLQSFVADPGLVEMFPVLADNGVHLVYRMAPFRITKSKEWAKFVASAIKQAESASPQAVTNAVFSGLSDSDFDNIMGDSSWSYKSADEISVESVFSTSRNLSDSRCVTLTTATVPTMPDAYAFLFGTSGLPIVDDMGLLTRGPRVYKPSWPFMENIDVHTPHADWAKYIKLIALEAAHYRMGLDYMARGSLSCIYSPQVRCGRVLKLSKSTATDMPPVHIMAGEEDVVVDDRGGVVKDDLYSYTTAITHSISMADSGQLDATSTILFDRQLPHDKEHQRYAPDANDVMYKFRGTK